MTKIKRALISVSDKTGLVELAKVLKSLKVEIISTGGTKKLLSDAGISTTSISDVTGFPEILDGRVKTLHPNIYGGLLYLRHDAEHRKTVAKHKIKPIDLVVVNLYPFTKVIANSKTSLKQAIENIDIGGPSMIRAAAKNYRSVGVVCDPADYAAVADELKTNKGALSESLLERLMVKAYQTTALYDQAIQHYFGKQFGEESKELPELLDVAFRKNATLRYGENPHQRAALYQRVGEKPKFSFKQLHGKELSYNNILDLDSAVDIMREFKEPTACVVKHNNPCGIASNSILSVAIEKAVDSDSLSAFGGIVGVNRPLDQKTAAVLLEKLSFFELIIAPKISKDALKLLQQRKNLRVIEVPHFEKIGPYDLRYVKGGILLQDRDEPIYKRHTQLRKQLKFVTKAKPSASDLESLLFAWSCAKVVRSNAIVLVQGKQTVGIGCGQMSRVDSVKLACEKAGTLAHGSALASDGFFPMPDNIEIAYKNGIRAIIQPGGSIKDPDVIQACDDHGIPMVLTNERHFKH